MFSSRYGLGLYILLMFLSRHYTYNQQQSIQNATVYASQRLTSLPANPYQKDERALSRKLPNSIFFWCPIIKINLGPLTALPIFCQYLATDTAHSSSSTPFSCRKDKREKPGNLPKTLLFRKSDSISYKYTFTQ